MPRTIGKAKDPDAQIAALHEKRVDLAKRRHELDAAAKAHGRVLDEVPERRRAVLLADARGEALPETLEQVEIDRRKAEVGAHDAHERIEALKTVEQEVGQEVDAVEDANPEHFIAQALAATEAFAAQKAEALRVTQALKEAGGEAAHRWSGVRKMFIRQGRSKPREVLTSDYGGPISELEKAPLPIPGGSVQAWEDFLAREAAERNAARTSNAKVAAQFASLG